MNTSLPLKPFSPNPPDTAGILSWVHIGDLHMRGAGQQNDLDLRAIGHTHYNEISHDGVGRQRLGSNDLSWTRFIWRSLIERKSCRCAGNRASDEIRALFGADKPARQRAKRDQDNALEAWPNMVCWQPSSAPTRTGESGR